MNRPNDDQKVYEALHRLLHDLVEALESRLADRADLWMQRLRRGGKKPESSNG